MAARHLFPAVLLTGVFCLAGTGATSAQAVEPAASVSDSSTMSSQVVLTITDGSRPQFSVRLPRGWSVYDQTLELTGKSGPSGMVIFSSVEVGKLTTDDFMKLMAQWDTGAVPAFFVDRGPAEKGTSCEGISEKAQKKLLKMVESSSVGKGDKVTAPFQAEPVTLGTCSGVRVQGEVQKASGDTWRFDVHALSDGKTMYMFALRNLKAQFEKNLAGYESAMATVRLAGK